jgi:hypothetical protein
MQFGRDNGLIGIKNNLVVVMEIANRRISKVPNSVRNFNRALILPVLLMQVTEGFPYKLVILRRTDCDPICSKKLTDGEVDPKCWTVFGVG